MHFQTTLEGAECVRRSDAGWQSVPGTRRSDEERAVTNRRTTQRWCDKGRRRRRSQPHFLYPCPPHNVAHSPGTAEPYHADIERREQIITSYEFRHHILIFLLTWNRSNRFGKLINNFCTRKGDEFNDSVQAITLFTIMLIKPTRKQIVLRLGGAYKTSDSIILLALLCFRFLRLLQSHYCTSTATELCTSSYLL